MVSHDMLLSAITIGRVSLRNKAIFFVVINKGSVYIILAAALSVQVIQNMQIFKILYNKINNLYKR